MCQKLRVLNAVRLYVIGIPLSYKQLEDLTIPVLLDRLVLRRQYCLAIEICKYLKIPENEGSTRILAHWACYMVQHKLEDDEIVAQMISEKLQDTPGVSYSKIANKAIEFGRTHLSIRLLDFEPRAAEQVPLLMKMKKDELALDKAVESGDTDLVYTVLLHLKDILPLGEFLMTIRNKPSAHDLFMQLCRQQNKAMLRDLYYQEDSHASEADCRVAESYEEERFESRLGSLNAALEAYKKAHNEWAVQQTQDSIKLLRLEREMEEERGGEEYLNLSLHELMYKLTLKGQHTRVKQIKKDFKVNDKRYWWIRVLALAEANDFVELEKFSKTKSPIGYEPFVEACIKYHNNEQALKYVQKVPLKNKVKSLLICRSFEEAAKVAYEQKSVESLNLVRIKCISVNRSLADKIETMIQQLNTK